MKKLLYAGLILGIIQSCSGPTTLEKRQTKDTFEKPDVLAKFAGGEQQFIEYVHNKLEYPTRCEEEDIDGYALLRFVVDTKGNVSNIKAIKATAACPEFTLEAIRVLKSSPKWIPGMVNGKFVNSYRTLHINFKVN